MPFCVINFIVSLFDFDGEDEGKEKFVLFEKRSADILVKGVGKVSVDVV